MLRNLLSALGIGQRDRSANVGEEAVESSPLNHLPSATHPEKGAEEAVQAHSEKPFLRDSAHQPANQSGVVLGTTNRWATSTLDNHPNTLSYEQEKVFKLIEESEQSVFVTGRAGSGKSFLLRYLIEKTAKNRMVVAPTGVAALNIGGVTIHSAFQFPPRFLDSETTTLHAERGLKYNQRVLLRNIDMLIIDEVSMVRADVMDAMDTVLRISREDERPFGGVQVVAFGDPFQLPPVVADKGLSEYFSDVLGGSAFFNSYVWGTAAPQTVQLIDSFRQNDGDFLDALDAIRIGHVTWSHLDVINERVRLDSDTPSYGTPRLTTRNAVASRINHSRLAEIDAPILTYSAIVEGENLQKVVPTEVELKLKVGAQVMIVANDGDNNRWVNGTMAEIAALELDQIFVRVDGITHSLPRYKWAKTNYIYNRETKRVEKQILGSFQQFPVKLGWAITIHKSQGQSYASCIVDLEGGAFETGQAYVGLSRCRSLESLYLTVPLELSDIRVDPAVTAFMERIQPVQSIPE